jgi:hypothetical protein
MAAVKRKILLAIAVLIVTTLPWVYGQAPAPRPVTTPPAPGGKAQVVAPPPQIVPPANVVSRRYDPARMSPLQQHLYLSAQRGAEWLQRRQKPDGRFIYGFSPSLRQPLEEDSYLAQIEATFVLARSARFFNNENAGFEARRALLTLLLNTTNDPKDKQIRYSIPPSTFVNRPAAAGLLLLAISELPAPPKIENDLLEAADQLASFLQRQVRPDGSVSMTEGAEQASSDGRGSDDVENFSGPALLGIVRSQKLRPMPWKLDALHKARAHYQSYWRQHKNAAMIREHSATFAEAFLLTRDNAFAEFVFEMNDWLLTQQYQNMDPARQLWTGGFMPRVEGKAVSLPPDVRSAVAAQSLADACRTARLAGDPGRLGRYKEGLESCLKFVTTMQYTEANTQHFAEWYRQMLVGGFHASSRDGDLRLDYTLHAVAAVVQYLEYVAELPL